MVAVETREEARKKGRTRGGSSSGSGSSSTSRTDSRNGPVPLGCWSRIQFINASSNSKGGPTASFEQAAAAALTLARSTSTAEPHNLSLLTGSSAAFSAASAPLCCHQATMQTLDEWRKRLKRREDERRVSRAAPQRADTQPANDSGTVSATATASYSCRRCIVLRQALGQAMESLEEWRVNEKRRKSVHKASQPTRQPASQPAAHAARSAQATDAMQRDSTRSRSPEKHIWPHTDLSVGWLSVPSLRTRSTWTRSSAALVADCCRRPASLRCSLPAAGGACHASAA